MGVGRRGARPRPRLLRRRRSNPTRNPRRLRRFLDRSKVGSGHACRSNRRRGPCRFQTAVLGRVDSLAPAIERFEMILLRRILICIFAMTASIAQADPPSARITPVDLHDVAWTTGLMAERFET